MKSHRRSSKESTSNLFNRYVWLADLIYRKKKISFEEINEYWQRASLNYNGEDIPLRTFHNHRKAIEQMFDINIECDKSNGYTYYIENTEDMKRGGVRSWLLNTFAVNNLINESRKLKQRILFENAPGGQEHLTTIIEAMRDNLGLLITYQAFWQDEAYTFEIFPYLMKVFKQRWYLIAYSPYRDKILIYALDRIAELATTDTPFSFPENSNLESFFDDSFGIIVDDNIEAENVVIKVHKNQDLYIKSLPLHHSQKEVNQTSSYTIFSYYIKPTFDFIQELLSHGEKIEILKPEWLRNEVAKIVFEQCELYKDYKLEK